MGAAPQEGAQFALGGRGRSVGSGGLDSWFWVRRGCVGWRRGLGGHAEPRSETGPAGGHGQYLTCGSNGWSVGPTGGDWVRSPAGGNTVNHRW